MLLHAGERLLLGAISEGMDGSLGSIRAGFGWGALVGSVLDGGIYNVRGLEAFLSITVGLLTGPSVVRLAESPRI